MEELRRQVRSLSTTWNSVFSAAMENPASWKGHVSEDTIVQLGEVIETLVLWLDRVKAPSGFAPGFHLAKSMAAIYIPSTLSTLQNISAGQFNLYPTLISNLVNLISAVHSMVAFSTKKDKLAAAADLTAVLSQSVALLETAQKELAEKLDSLEATNAAIDRIEHADEVLNEHRQSSEGHLKEIQDNVDKSGHLIVEIREGAGYIEGAKTQLDGLLNENEMLRTKSEQALEKLELLQERSEKQEEVIDSILPRGASAGLAAAFSRRDRQLRWSKWAWMSAFVISVSLLAYVAWGLANKELVPQEYMYYIVARIPLAAPLIWLGWFSSVQYGNIVRIQEDYAFKEATSKAFQGYRDHMEHLADVELHDAQTALRLLSERTIEILAKEPLRVFGQAHHDAAPATKLFDYLNRRGQKTSQEEAE